MHLGFGATPQRPTITVTRGTSTLAEPKTDASARAWAKSHPQTSLSTAPLRMIPWNIVHHGLMRLNRNFFFAPYGDGRVIICIDEVAPKAAFDYESLSYYEKREADSRHEIKGPRKACIMAPSNAVSAYTDIICAAPAQPHAPLARSLATICRVLVTHYNAFTWEAAERVFGMPLRDIPVHRQFMGLTHKQFNERRDGAISITSAQGGK